jgi:hypothetical protein
MFRHVVVRRRDAREPVPMPAGHGERDESAMVRG